MKVGNEGAWMPAVDLHERPVASSFDFRQTLGQVDDDFVAASQVGNRVIQIDFPPASGC